MQENIINVGDYVIIQRQQYTKLQKIKEHGTTTLGKDVIELDNIVGHKFYETFKMQLKPNNKRLYTLEKVTELTIKNEINLEQSGNDNRNIIDDGTSQGLTKDEIENLRDQALSSTDIVEKLIANSKTFNFKTEFSQEKYLKKKEKKYFEYIQVRKPTIRLLSLIFYRQDPKKTLGLRIDDLSQVLTYGNIQSDGDYLLYDTGTSGLVPAAILHAIGADTTGRLIHAHPGNECQKLALLAMQFPKELMERCIHVNLYSVLRCFYQEKESFNENGDCSEPKRCKLEEPKKPCWQFENEKACRILEEKIDSLIVVGKEDPTNIVKELVQFLKPSRTLVVFNLIKEPLQDLYFYLKNRKDFIAVKLSNNFMRNYQVLPERTHPEVAMNFGGYILSGYKIAD